MRHTEIITHGTKLISTRISKSSGPLTGLDIRVEGTNEETLSIFLFLSDLSQPDRRAMLRSFAEQLLAELARNGVDGIEVEENTREPSLSANT